MNAMTILKRCWDAAEDIRNLEDRIQQKRETLTSISAPQADPNGGGHGSGGTKDKIGAIYAEIDVLERELIRRKEAEKAEKVAACALTEMLPDLGRKILFRYYVKKQNTSQIARQMKYQPSYVRKVKRDAEQLLGMLAPERVDETLPQWYLKAEGGDKG